MQFSLFDDKQKDDDLRKHSLAALDMLIRLDMEHAAKARKRWEKKPPKDRKGTPSGRIKNGDLFIISRKENPIWNQRPDTWAPDWCKGWAFQPNSALATALGVTLEKREKTIGHHVVFEDGRIQPDYEKDEKGNIKLTPAGNPVIKTLKKYYMVWVQSTAFNFREGYAVHSAPLKHQHNSWGEQIASNRWTAQVIQAYPAIPLYENFSRSPGYVKFRLYERQPDRASMIEKSIHETTQDGFVRYLITGELS